MHVKFQSPFSAITAEGVEVTVAVNIHFLHSKERTSSSAEKFQSQRKTFGQT